LADLFGYAPAPVEASEKILETHPKYTVKEISFDLHLPPGLAGRPVDEMRREVEKKYSENDLKGARDLELEYTVKIDYYQTAGEGKKPLILVSPILGGNMIVDWFAAFFASHGLNAAIVHRRKPRYQSDEELDQVDRYVRKSVIRTRQALDWLAGRPETDPSKIGSFGISYGGIVNTYTAAVEPRIQCHIIAMAGGPLADLIVDSEEKAIQKYIRTAAEQKGYTPETLRAALKTAIHSDILHLAPHIDPGRVLFVIAYFDRVVARRYTRQLWEALGKPEVIYTPLGHYGTILASPYLKGRALKFYRSRFFPPREAGNKGIIFSRKDPSD
jgi:dienelactone hydrolase